MKEDNIILDKSYELALEIIKLVKSIPRKSENFALINQIVKSGTSVGANVEEAIAASSRNDFVHKMNIALKEARETNYWLRLFRDARIAESKDISAVLNLSTEVMKIAGAIVRTTRSR
jgi:four helix bundle protein